MIGRLYRVEFHGWRTSKTTGRDYKFFLVQYVEGSEHDADAMTTAGQPATQQPQSQGAGQPSNQYLSAQQIAELTSYCEGLESIHPDSIDRVLSECGIDLVSSRPIPRSAATDAVKRLKAMAAQAASRRRKAANRRTARATQATQRTVAQRSISMVC